MKEVKPRPVKKRISSITPEFVTSVDKFVKEYKDVLTELAKK